MGDQVFTYDSWQYLSANQFSRAGYTFAGWSDGHTTYSNGQYVANLTTVNGGIVTLYAQWTEAVYNIHYDLSGAVD